MLNNGDLNPIVSDTYMAASHFGSLSKFVDSDENSF
jgi:hypothetical protein